jgi:hypothetical protein
MPAQHFLPFGKHRGKPLPQVPTGYLRWALDTVKLSTGLRAAVRGELLSRGVHPSRLSPEPVPRPVRCPWCGPGVGAGQPGAGGPHQAMCARPASDATSDLRDHEAAADVPLMRPAEYADLLADVKAERVTRLEAALQAVPADAEDLRLQLRKPASQGHPRPPDSRPRCLRCSARNASASSWVAKSTVAHAPVGSQCW